jgi:hypothetical protein
MKNTQAAELANTLAIRQVKSDIRRMKLLQFIPRYRGLLVVYQSWLAILTARAEQLGEGSRKRLRRTA